MAEQGAMYEGYRVAAVTPAFNGSQHIADVVYRVPESVDRVIVVDDHSSDGTVAAAAAVADPRLQIIQHHAGCIRWRVVTLPPLAP